MSASPSAAAVITVARRAFHAKLFASGALTIELSGRASIADNTNKTSRLIATGLIRQLAGQAGSIPLKAQTLGKTFEDATREYLQDVLPSIAQLLPGTFDVLRGVPISAFAQYRHLRVLESLAEERREVELALGGDYLVAPDVTVARRPMTTAEMNRSAPVVDDAFGTLAALRRAQDPILHASVSCKATIRSDRSQNSRLEALNLLRQRRGRAPHIVVVTAEPLPSRISSIAVGTGDFDCVYHAALPELCAAMDDAVAEAHAARKRPDRATKIEKDRLEQARRLKLMIDSNRLKDIADLPLDLAL